VFLRKLTARLAISEANFEMIRQSCMHKPCKSISRHSLGLGIPESTIHRVLQNRLILHAYEIQLLDEIK
jgi:hypothetical protein